MNLLKHLCQWHVYQAEDVENWTKYGLVNNKDIFIANNTHHISPLLGGEMEETTARSEGGKDGKWREYHAKKTWKVFYNIIILDRIYVFDSYCMIYTYIYIRIYICVCVFDLIFIYIYIYLYIRNNNQVINKLYESFQSPWCKVRYMIILWINIASQRYVLSFQMDHTYTFDVTSQKKMALCRWEKVQICCCKA